MPQHFCSPVDRACVRSLRAPYDVARPSKPWESTLRKAVLMFSDQQLVTGIAILTSAYPQLPYGISSYHWQIVVYLAWFSSVTHLTTLTMLRQYFQDHPPIRNWRLCLMLLTNAMLMVALLPTGDQDWIETGLFAYYGGVPASCYFQRLSTGEYFYFRTSQAITMLVSIFILTFGYIIRVVRLSASTSSMIRKWLIIKPSRILNLALDKTYDRLADSKAQSYARLQYVILQVCRINLRASLDAFGSLLWEVRLQNS